MVRSTYLLKKVWHEWPRGVVISIVPRIIKTLRNTNVVRKGWHAALVYRRVGLALCTASGQRNVGRC